MFSRFRLLEIKGLNLENEKKQNGFAGKALNLWILL